MSHYETLGVPATASAAELRHAYRQRAMVLHPDTMVGRAPDEQRAAEREMQLLNEAWHVLSDPVRRRQYDEARRGPTATTDPDPEPPVERSDLLIADEGADATLARLIPVALVLLVLGAIVVFTAFAGGGSSEPGDPTTLAPASSAGVGDCIVVRGGHVSSVVACDRPNDGQVAREIDRTTACPGDERRVDSTNGTTALCVVEWPTGSSTP